MTSWVRFRSGTDDVGFGIRVGDRIDCHDGSLFDSPQPRGESLAAAGVALLEPCRPDKIVALWNNFHALASKLGKAAPSHPLFLIKPSSSVIGPGADIERPRGYIGKIAFEGELGIVIGRRCRQVAPAQSAEYIFGYTCVNDITAIGVMNENPDFVQWCRAKGFDTFGALGPAIVTGLDWRLRQRGHDGRRRRAATLRTVRHDLCARGDRQSHLARYDAVAGRCDRLRHIDRCRLHSGWRHGRSVD